VPIVGNVCGPIEFRLALFAVDPLRVVLALNAFAPALVNSLGRHTLPLPFHLRVVFAPVGMVETLAR
jgi:hypothetical protein